MSGKNVDRARLLMGQARYEQAAAELSNELASEPANAPARALLALCFANLGRHADAEREARAAVGDAPNYPFAHYALAAVFEDQERLDDAESAIVEALRLDPEVAAYYGLFASIALQRRRWKAALEAADEGLSIDPESAQCANLRAIALRQLGLAGAAGREIETALGQDPENPVTHLNQGWQMVEVGDYDRAMEHFREALRLDPNLDAAREGVVEVLRARNPLYRPLLRYFLFMSKLQGWGVWAVLIGIFVVQRSLRTAMKSQPELVPYLMPIFVLLVAFVMLTWIAGPLFNLTLRLHPLGRLALTRDEIRASNWVGGLLVTGIVLGVVWYLKPIAGLGVAAAACVMMVVPISATAEFERPKGRKILRVYTAVLAVAAALAVVLSIAGSNAAFLPGIVFVLGFLVFGWVANILAMRT
jgi:tetratricopeptide (TPR) repeat protein